MSDTERAIEILENNQTYMKGDPNEWAYDLAITALRTQSEAEKKIEAVKALCDEQEYPCYDGEGHEWSDGCKIGRFNLATEILAILEADDD